MIRRFLIADLHLSHPKLVESGFRPAGYESILLDNWHRAVSREDRVYVLGDVIFRRAGDLPNWLNAVPGKKILVRGNHDMEKSSWYMRRGFDFVVSAIEHKDVLLTHLPRVPLPDHIRLNVHGHFHSLDSSPEHYWRRRADFEPYYTQHRDKYRLIALEPDYSPVPWEDVVG